MKKLVAVFSGGLDSTVLLSHLLQQGLLGLAVSFNYGQRHADRELGAAARIAQRLQVPHLVLDWAFLGKVIAGESALLNDRYEIPKGHYEDESMKATVVPNRNMIMLSVATGISIANGFGGVAIGAHAGDHAVYPDCRPEFLEACGSALALADYTHQELLRPFEHIRKEEIVKIGSTLDAPMELTWSCYEGMDVHCGTCGTCVERKEAFELGGVADLTEYR